MAGMVCIHPKQVEVVSATFAATRKRLIYTPRALLMHLDKACQAGKGAIMFEGTMLDLPIVERARRIVAQGPAGPHREGWRLTQK